MTERPHIRQSSLAAVTVTASDPDGASAVQTISVTVKAGAVNQAPVAVGTIPGSSLAIGGTSTIDASGYFSDADGDEVTYTGSSSNEGVATVAMEGSSATITAVAAGDAVITITASDGEASVSQGFRVDVSSGPKPATVSIFGVQDLSGGSVDPTNVSGNVNVLVNYESNDEVVVGIELLIDDYAMHCRGSTGSGESDLAGSGSQVEIPCLFNTAAVMGECSGAQMAPMFSNGEVVLGARLHTQGGDTRDALATQAITLKNSNYVMVGHSAGSNHVLVGGMPLYGGSSEAEGNMNSFSACPVAFDGTTVGKMSLRALSTGADKATPHQAATSLSFMAPTTMPAATFNGMAADRERADGFTWAANSDWNGMVEDEGPGGREHWVFAGEKLENDSGVDVSADFGIENPFGPYYFDFKGPVPGSIQVNKADPAGQHYSAAKDNAIALSSVTDMGAGVDDASIMIAVGDCSAAANNVNVPAAMMPDRTKTPFDAMYASVSHISDLAEEDATRDGPGKDSNGLDCYVAELTSLADKLGNAWSGRKAPGSWKQTAAFGVDKTKAVLSDIEPDDQGLVFGEKPDMTFEVDNPKLASGDDGTGLEYEVEQKVGKNYVAAGSAAPDGRDVTVTLDDAVIAEDGAKSVRVTVSDGATPANEASYTLDFGFDTKAPTYSISRTQGNIGRTGASSVTAAVEGTVSDANNIETATLRLLRPNAEGVCYAGDLDAIPTADTLPTARLTGGYKRNLADGTAKSVSLNSTFTIKPPDPLPAMSDDPEAFCFRLDVEDVAVESHGRGDGNDETYADVGSFSVDWPRVADPPDPPPPGPTFTFTSNEGDATATENTAVTELDVPEGSTDRTYYVHLSDEADTPTATAPVNVTITAAPGLSVTPRTFDFWDETLGTPAPHDSILVTITTAHDLDIVSNVGALTHSATGFDDATLMVTSEDDDFVITTDVASIEEDDAATEVTVTVTAGTATSAARTVTVDLGYPSGDAETTPAAPTTATVVIAADATSGDTTVNVDALDDIVQDEANEEIGLTVSGSAPTGTGPYYKPASIAIVDNDPDITVSLMVDGVATDEVSEAAGTVTVTITATADAPVGGITTFTLAEGGGVNSPTDYLDNLGTITLTINARETTASTDITLTLVDDSNVEGTEILELADADGASDGTKTWSIQTAKLKFIDNDSS